MDIRLTTRFITPPFSLFFMFEFLVKVEYIAKSKFPLVLRAVSPQPGPPRRVESLTRQRLV